MNPAPSQPDQAPSPSSPRPAGTRPPEAPPLNPHPDPEPRRVATSTLVRPQNEIQPRDVQQHRIVQHRVRKPRHHVPRATLDHRIRMRHSQRFPRAAQTLEVALEGEHPTSQAPPPMLARAGIRSRCPAPAGGRPPPPEPCRPPSPPTSRPAEEHARPMSRLRRPVEPRCGACVLPAPTLTRCCPGRWAALSGRGSRPAGGEVAGVGYGVALRFRGRSGRRRGRTGSRPPAVSGNAAQLHKPPPTLAGSTCGRPSRNPASTHDRWSFCGGPTSAS